MAIDNCPHTFEELASRVLPSHMSRMLKAFATPHKMETFGNIGIGPKTILERMGRTRDFSGCYVLLEKRKPIYIGISRSIIQRLIQHVKGKTHYDASLAYRMASIKYSHNLEREAAMKNPDFRKEFELSKEYLKKLDVAFIEITNDVELYLFEVFCAMELNTPWNTFRTH
jgi:predicted GIY-YIG superfamily endonuclease